METTPKIKICGITSYEDAEVAARAGANYLGFIINFPKSPRHLEPASAQKIITDIKNQFPKIKCVGVFIDQPISEVQKIIQNLALDIAQLHGQESPAYCSELRAKVEVWKAIIIKNTADLAAIDQYSATTDKILFDAGQGNGTQIDPTLLAGRSIDILAGGLTPENVGASIAFLHPAIVDLNSGVESAPGKKDPTKIQAAIKAINLNS